MNLKQTTNAHDPLQLAGNCVQAEAEPAAGRRCLPVAAVIFSLSVLAATWAPGVWATEAEAAPEESADAAPAASSDLPSLDELLNRVEEDPTTYTERCISTRRIRSHRVLDSQHLVFEMTNREHYLVQFPRRCFGLRRGDPISYSSNSGRLCKLDAIRPLEYRGRGLEPGIPCYIPEFQKVTPEQIDYLTEALKAQREARRRR